jgi:copper chaperone
MKETFNVPDVSCGHCKSAIEGALVPLAGVRGAEVNIDSKKVDVDYDDGVIDRTGVVRAIEASGYEVAG